MAAGIEMKRDHCSEGCHTPPGVPQNEITDFAPQAPVDNDGSSFLDTADGYYPIDPEIGLPYPVMVFGLKKYREQTYRHNSHHPESPRKAIELEGNLPLKDPRNLLLQVDSFSYEQIAGIAVRVSRVYRLDPAIHMMLHAQNPNGTRLARSNVDKFARVVKNLSGIISRHAYDPTAPEGSRIRRMSPDNFKEQTTAFWVYPEEYAFERPEGYQRIFIAHFLTRFMAEQDISYVNRSLIDEFVSSKDPNRRFKIGQKLMRAATAVSIDPLQEPFKRYKRLGLVQSSVQEESKQLFDVVYDLAKPALKHGVAILSRRLAA